MAKTTVAWPVGAQLKNVVTVERVPDWVRSGDVIVKRDKRYFVVSLHQSEPRYRALWRRVIQWLK